jgi:hypothetical protein
LKKKNIEITLKKVKLEVDEGMQKTKEANVCFKCIGACRGKINTFVKTKFFVRGILAAILINTLSMGVEHHNQPDILTQIVEYSNYLFTTIFFMEMVLKIISEGVFNYIKNAFNIFDGAIVGLRYIVSGILSINLLPLPRLSD